MSFLNANIPLIECYVRGNYLRNQEDSHDKYFPCVVFGITSIPGQSPLFHFVMEDGALWSRSPISAFCWKKDVPEEDLHELMVWDSYSYYIAVTQYFALKHSQIEYTNRSGQKINGRYLFTLDWAHPGVNEIDFGYSERPFEHVAGHVLKLDNGNFAIQPNNRMRVFDSGYVTKPGEDLIEKKSNTHIFTVEDKPKWYKKV